MLNKFKKIVLLIRNIFRYFEKVANMLHLLLQLSEVSDEIVEFTDCYKHFVVF